MIGKDRYRNLPEFPDYSKVMEIDFQNTPGRNQLHVPERMEIREIKFRKDLRPVLWFSLYGCFGYLLIVGIILLVHWLLIIKDKKSSKGSPVSSLPSIQPDQLPVMASDKHLQIKPRDEEDTDRLDTYLKNNYQNPDLLIETVSTQTGISTDRISVLLKKKYKMGIREYLNYLRIEEAKYQLKATDRGVAEIAFKVGYNNIPNFNRVFKELVGCAPREFREQGDGGNES